NSPQARHRPNHPVILQRYAHEFACLPPTKQVRRFEETAGRVAPAPAKLDDEIGSELEGKGEELRPLKEIQIGRPAYCFNHGPKPLGRGCQLVALIPKGLCRGWQHQRLATVILWSLGLNGEDTCCRRHWSLRWAGIMISRMGCLQLSLADSRPSCGAGREFTQP